MKKPFQNPRANCTIWWKLESCKCQRGKDNLQKQKQDVLNPFLEFSSHWKDTCKIKHGLWEKPQRNIYIYIIKTLGPPCLNMSLIEGPKLLQRIWNIPVQDPYQKQILQELSAELRKAPTPSQKAAKNSTSMLKAKKFPHYSCMVHHCNHNSHNWHTYMIFHSFWPSKCVAEEGR